MLKRSNYIIVIAVFVVLGLAMAYPWWTSPTPQALSPARIKFLMTELTVTPGQQQVALDEIVRGGSDAVVLLYPYLHDRRQLASKNVKFLNAQSPAVEKYFLTVATTVDELTLRYLCWTTMVCRPDFDGKKDESRRLQLQELASDCVRRLPKAEQCHLILSVIENRPK